MWTFERGIDCRFFDGRMNRNQLRAGHLTCKPCRFGAMGPDAAGGEKLADGQETEMRKIVFSHQRGVVSLGDRIRQATT